MRQAEAAQQAAKQAEASKAAPEKPQLKKFHPADRVDISPFPEPNHFLHKVFAVRNYTQFPFVVPPNIVNPKLRGNYRSFIKGSGFDPARSKAADVDLALLNEQEFADFANGRPGSATYEIDSSHDQAVDYAVPPTHGHPQPYHLVFRNPARSGTRFVDADFTVSFE